MAPENGITETEKRPENGLALIKRTIFFFGKSLKLKMETKKNTRESKHRKKIDSGQVDRQIFRMHSTPYGILMCRMWLSSPSLSPSSLSPDTAISCYRLHTIHVHKTYQHASDNNTVYHCTAHSPAHTIFRFYTISPFGYAHSINSIKIIGGGFKKLNI